MTPVGNPVTLTTSDGVTTSDVVTPTDSVAASHSKHDDFSAEFCQPRESARHVADGVTPSDAKHSDR
jgi:hypothetical protein